MRFSHFEQEFGCNPVFNLHVYEIAKKMEAADPFGNLHCVVDDGNLKDDDLIDYLDEPLLKEEKELVKELLERSYAERATAYALYQGDYLLDYENLKPGYV